MPSASVLVMRRAPWPQTISRSWASRVMPLQWPQHSHIRATAVFDPKGADHGPFRAFFPPDQPAMHHIGKQEVIAAPDRSLRKAEATRDTLDLGQRRDDTFEGRVKHDEASGHGLTFLFTIGQMGLSSRNRPRACRPDSMDGTRDIEVSPASSYVVRNSLPIGNMPCRAPRTDRPSRPSRRGVRALRGRPVWRAWLLRRPGRAWSEKGRLLDALDLQ